jgi:hypothetical protein
MPEFVDIEGKTRRFDYDYEGQKEYEIAYQKDIKRRQAPQVSQNIQNQGTNLVKDMTNTWEAPGNMNPAEIKGFQNEMYNVAIIKNRDDYEPGKWNEVTQRAHERHLFYIGEGTSRTNIYRREIGLPDKEEKIEDILIDKMGDTGGLPESEVKFQANKIAAADEMREGKNQDDGEMMYERRLSGMDSY